MSPSILLFAVALLGEMPEGPDAALRRDLRVAVHVVRIGSQAPGAFLEVLESALTSAMVAKGCFGGFGDAGEGGPRPADLELQIAFDDFQDEVAFQASIAERSAPGGGGELQRQLAAVVEAEFRVELRLPGPNGAVVRADRYRRQVSYRPVLDEDPRSEALERMAATVAQAVQRFSCDGSEKRFQRDRARAREASLP